MNIWWEFRHLLGARQRGNLRSREEQGTLLEHKNHHKTKRRTWVRIIFLCSNPLIQMAKMRALVLIRNIHKVGTVEMRFLIIWPLESNKVVIVLFCFPLLMFLFKSNVIKMSSFFIHFQKRLEKSPTLNISISTGKQTF